MLLSFGAASSLINPLHCQFNPVETSTPLYPGTFSAIRATTLSTHQRLSY